MIYHHEYLYETKGTAELPDVDDLIFEEGDGRESQR